jgi:PKD repeat protein
VADETNTLTVTATDADNDPLAYQWVFGDGANTNTAIGIVNHVYTNDCGPYSASVTVSDGQASTNSDLTVVVACQMQITRMRADLNFRRASADSCSFTADLSLTNGFTLAGQRVTFDIGGAQSSFTLDAKNKAVNTQGRCAFKFNKKNGNWTITVKLARSSFQGAWADDGLVNADVRKPGNSVTLSVTVLVGNEAFVADKTLSYTAKAGRSGAAK